MQHNENSSIDDNEFVSDSDYNNQYYAINAIEINKIISYKCDCSFENSESEAHVYNSSRIEPGAKISHSKTINALLKSKSSVKNYNKLRYKTDSKQSQTPFACMKLMSVSDMFFQMLTYSATRELLRYRANQKSVAGQLINIFDGDSYKQLV
ncbi:hypothetical protein PHYBLDRAFT_72908 [Phycomyces blakesleeanus NRRL 1555(-)]|uniref:Uncharacterized protein n=1 Tax=Phycomyces blakesleeanus (strain ATCC 8743b / DSM 1359 / FGSC 10004 / NBRC 33097 / NRRL 1555) TaxID=763407 RepID=A0A162VAE8_PHYB8|nr:hypothetical protein PHYBLDRAFT_72908 [Phycomyces blakesleeanus NRRL 1555(-)]OAD81222.1 hypothetical protein PHYBLDRAFT_72908 [Phycomyces blakesleeanus NRRL 1555(-)]|eukprot:XP_018299262.1 hypothetical protein PHYBLDRAFT_72908 [Phycomyces blakesleeanus NRRL 1555(-)]